MHWRVVYHLGTFSDDGGILTDVIAPTFNTKMKPKNNDASKKYGNKTDDTTQPASRQHPNWVPIATLLLEG